MGLVCAVIAVVLFVLRAFGVQWESVEILSLGLAFFALAFVLGGLSFPIRFRSERE